MLRFTAGKKDQHIRADNFVVSKIKRVSRSFVHKLAGTDKLLVNGEPQKAGYKLKPGDKISIDYDVNKNGQDPMPHIPIIYEDKDCLVINKPAGVLTHSKGNFNPETTIATFISDKIQDMEGDRAGIAHRLDRTTSGVIICAKTPEALKWLQKQFSTRKVKKTYYAIVNGGVEPAKAIIDMPIGRHPKRPQTFRAASDGRTATTRYEVVRSKDNYSLVKLTPTTGRTHQLRVHLKQIKHPIVGDTLYGGEEAERLFLHAESLEVTLPSRERKTFTAKLPKIFNEKLGVQ